MIGLDDSPAEYWFDNRIHTFGNMGLWGGIHALMALLATRLINDAVYKGIDAMDIVSFFVCFCFVLFVFWFLQKYDYCSAIRLEYITFNAIQYTVMVVTNCKRPRLSLFFVLFL